MAVIDNLKNRLLNDDRAKANEIEKEAKTKADEILNAAKNKAETIFEEMKAKAEKDGKERKERLIARAQLEARNQLLSSKQEAIDKVLEAAKNKLENMSSEDYSSFIECMLLNNIETGDEEVILSQKDKARINPDVVENVNRKLVSNGKKGQIKLVDEVRNIQSGFILKKGGLEINCSIDSQIRILRDSLEGEIANLLFEGR
ncbi:hypothetical protein Q428_08575 [Fervidicella metallireducens AeB]|uniref:V-type proton ATPase subunit E n=1 Tax=Fervidicella metallireducens AeB TaxID=1403537 RepID=A0A017RUA3_9CLOT|nr:V-type ATP synthase subunit E [Fervidicella metallireducens]EYE88353.1 hypothetical protein Q428_08575 [Fervidicella metallireducens AeB]